MRSKLIFLAAVLPVLFACTEGVPASIAPRNPLRAPAYPLITIDPYTNAWSTTENLFDSAPQHWTGKDYPLSGYLTVDGTVYRFMGSGSSIVRSELLPSAATGSWSARYTLDEAGEEWTDPAFDDSAWAEGKAASAPFPTAVASTGLPGPRGPSGCGGIFPFPRCPERP